MSTMRGRREGDVLTDHEVLVTIVTAYLIRDGGHTTFSKDEWEEAVEHDGSLYFNRKDEEDPMTVALMRRVGEAVQ